MSVYTFIFNHKNTICTRQAQGQTLVEAVERWLPSLENVQFGKDENKAALDLDVIRHELKESRFVPLKDVNNVWCAFLRFEGINAIVEVVLTQGESNESYALDSDVLV